MDNKTVKKVVDLHRNLLSIDETIKKINTQVMDGVDEMDLEFLNKKDMEELKGELKKVILAKLDKVKNVYKKQLKDL